MEKLLEERLKDLLHPNCDPHDWSKELAQFQDETAVPILIKILGDDQESRFTRKTAISALCILHDEQAIPILLETLHSPDPIFRARAAEALGSYTILNKDEVEQVIKGLNDEDYLVRKNCAKALSKLNFNQALSTLKKMSTDDDVSTNREVARQAIQKIREGANHA